jgi:hypothetical protein
MTYNNIIAGKKIRARIEHLGSKLRLCYSAARQPQNNQASRDQAVVEVVLLYKQLRRWQNSLELLRADDLALKTQRIAAAAALLVETPAESALAL